MYNNYNCIWDDDYNWCGKDHNRDLYVKQIIDPFIWIAFSLLLGDGHVTTRCQFLIMAKSQLDNSSSDHLAYFTDSPLPGWGLYNNGRKRGVISSIPELVTKQTNRLTSVLSLMDTT